MITAAYIPCRKGSSRLKDKNFRKFVGDMSLTDLAINQACLSRLIDIVLVDTNNDEYLEKLKTLNHKKQVVGMRRPENFAMGASTTQQTMQHMLGKFEDKFGKAIDNLVLLQPTSPLRRWQTIDKAIHVYNSRETTLITAVSECPININDTIQIKPDGKTISECISKTIENPLFITGSIYILTAERLLTHKLPFQPNNINNLFKVPFDEFLDIDYDYQYDLSKIIYLNRN